ncbi:unnamed protein product, partial [Mesorhabditis belari]|uniref:Neurotransmitter-gated ion-channel ligand-binding domain-containing protein n=1 Tax=Mesorhabditis belari TaxID=2138241 RepID=A0AAF3FM85_9BILA
MSLSIPEKKIYLIAGNGEWSISRITSQIDFYNTTSYANRKEDQLIKLSIGLTSLMSIAVLLQIVTDSIPKSKTFPLLGVYAIVCVFIIACGCAVLITIPRSIDEPILKKYEQHRLAWNPEQFDRIDEIFVNPAELWQPEDNLYNSATIKEVYPPEIKTAKIKSSGKVSLLRKQYLESYCWMEDIGVFPFDHEICSLFFMVYSYDYFDVSITVSCNSFDFGEFAGNSEWYAENITCKLEFYDDGEYAKAYESVSFVHWHIEISKLLTQQ